MVAAAHNRTQSRCMEAWLRASLTGTAPSGGDLDNISLPPLDVGRSASARIESEIIAGGGSVAASTREVIRTFSDRVLSRFSGADYERVLVAACLAARVHAHQTPRLDQVPFVNHPFEAAILGALEFGVGTADQLCALLLHDTVEDQAEDLAQLLIQLDRAGGGSGRPSASKNVPGRTPDQVLALQLIERLLGERVSALVDLLTNGPFVEMAKEQLMRERGASALELGNDSPDVLRIKHRLYRSHVMDLFEGSIRDPAGRTHLSSYAARLSPAERIGLYGDAFAAKALDFLLNVEDLVCLKPKTPAHEAKRIAMIHKRGGLTRVFVQELPYLKESHPLYEGRTKLAERLKTCYEQLPYPEMPKQARSGS